MPYENERIQLLEAQVIELTHSVTQLTAGLILALSNDGNSYAAERAVDTATSGVNRLVPILQRGNATMSPLGFTTSPTWHPYLPPDFFQLPSTPAITQLEEGRSVWDRLMDDQIP